MYRYGFQWFFDQYFGKADDKFGQWKGRRRHVHAYAKQEGKKGEDKMSLFKKKLTEQEAALHFVGVIMNETSSAWPIHL